MSPYCQLTPGCYNPKEGNTTGCASCNAAERKRVKNKMKVKVVEPIRKVADKRAGQLREYSKLRKEYLALYPVCEVEDCNEMATEIHHQRGAEGERLLDTNFFFAVCRAHHTHYTEHSKEAIELGVSLPRNH